MGNSKKQNYKIIIVDNDIKVINAISKVLKNSGFSLVGLTNPIDAIERIKHEYFDLMILDFIMAPINGARVVNEIRKFDQDIYILLLTDHKDFVPPLETIKKLAIQGFCEKGNNFDQLFLLIESALKSIEQMRTIKNINSELQLSKEELEKAYLESIEVLRDIVEAKSKYTRGHSDKVSAVSMLIGKHMNLSEADLQTLKFGSLFHDIGKIGIPDELLMKPR